MRKLGIIGGLSWIATHAYYERINRMVQKQVSAPAAPPLVIESLDYCQVQQLRNAEQWDAIGTVLADSARRLEGAGAEGVVIAANTMHKAFDAVAGAVQLPVLHIADAVADALKAKAVRKVALLGTRYVMTGSFYRKRLVAQGIDVLPPAPEEVAAIDRIIYQELVMGRATRNAERELRTIITHQERDGADAIVLACAELELVVDTHANILPVFDSTTIHCRAAADWILAG